MKSVAVFCASSLPKEEVYKEEALKLADYFIKHKLTLVYGGASVGIMGIIADRILEQGGSVIGVMPEILSNKEIMHKNLTETHIVKDMSVRKNLITDLSDHFIAFPGGCGTMDEIFEVITLNQIGQINKSCGFINTDGYYDGIKTYLDKATQVGLVSESNNLEIVFDSDIESFMSKLLK